MSLPIHAATAEEVARLWPAVSADHLFVDQAAFCDYYAQAPWHVRVTRRGEAALLGVWREHLDVLAMRAVWSAERSVPDFVADAMEAARVHGFGRLLSPLLPQVLLGGYRSAGMRTGMGRSRTWTGRSSRSRWGGPGICRGI